MATSLVIRPPNMTRPMSFAIGHDTPLSFGYNSNQVLWELKVNVDLPNWPDWTRKVPVEVLP